MLTGALPQPDEAGEGYEVAPVISCFLYDIAGVL
jgi:hypothetical protein